MQLLKYRSKQAWRGEEANYLLVWLFIWLSEWLLLQVFTINIFYFLHSNKNIWICFTSPSYAHGGASTIIQPTFFTSFYWCVSPCKPFFESSALKQRNMLRLKCSPLRPSILLEVFCSLLNSTSDIKTTVTYPQLEFEEIKFPFNTSEVPK
jgi:hypothetical protein